MKNNIILDCVVIKRFNIGESDRIITFFSKELGKIRAICKGIRRIKTKFSGNLEPFQRIQVTIHKGTKWNKVIEVNPKYKFFGIKNSSIYVLNIMAEVIDKFCQEEDQNTDLYKNMLMLLELLSLDVNQNLLIESFKLQLLKLKGYLPSFYNCLRCEQKFSRDTGLCFINDYNGFICKGCLKEDIYEELTFDNLKLINYLKEYPLQNTLNLVVTNKGFELIKRITNIMIYKYIDTLKSEEVYLK